MTTKGNKWGETGQKFLMLKGEKSGLYFLLLLVFCFVFVCVCVCVPTYVCVLRPLGLYVIWGQEISEWGLEESSVAKTQIYYLPFNLTHLKVREVKFENSFSFSIRPK